MDPIQIFIIKEDLKTQLDFQIQTEFKITYDRYRKLPYYLGAWTLAILAITLLSNSKSLITFKAVSITLTVLVWVVGLIFLSTILFKRLKRNKWRNDSIKNFNKNPKSFSIAFDNEKITFITDNYKTEINWGYYKYYAENANSIHIFPEDNVYGGIYYSENELGQDNYDLLKNIVQSKLIDLNSKSV